MKQKKAGTGDLRKNKEKGAVYTAPFLVLIENAVIRRFPVVCFHYHRRHCVVFLRGERRGVRA